MTATAGGFVALQTGSPAFAACTSIVAAQSIAAGGVPVPCSSTTPTATPTATATASPTPTASTSATSAPLPTVTPTATASMNVTIGDDGWITYTQPEADSLNLVSPTTQTVTGAFDSDGICTISASGDQVTGAAATWVEDTAYNPTTCQERLVVGGITDQAVTALTDPMDAAASSSSTLESAASTDSATAAATSYSSAYEKTKWIDPLNITITSMTANLKWPLYGAGGTLTGRINPYKFKYDGWSTSGTPAVRFATLSGDAGWSVNAPEKFTNSDFADFIYLTLGLSGWLACGAHATDTAHFYHNVTVKGYRSGSRGWAYSDKKDGACSNLVHHGQYSGWGWTS